MQARLLGKALLSKVPLHAETPHVTVVIGRFDGFVRHGLTAVLRDDPSIKVLATELDEAALERAASRPTAQVIIVDEAIELELLAKLVSNQPAPGVLVLADDPAHLYRTLLLARGVICLARAASATETCAAVHAAARGEPEAAESESARSSGSRADSN